MKRTHLTFCLLFGLFMAAQAQYRMRVMEWNVENLFDCLHDTLKNDHEFLPEGSNQWTWGRYWRKQQDIARVVMGVGGDKPADFVGLCEVENDSCMRDLTERSILRTIGYKYVMTDSPDHRGVDVALMYLPLRFRLLGSESKRVPSAHPTRDILHAWGVVANKDTLHIVVCHFPSRTGNSRTGNKNRMLAARTMAALVDSIGLERNILVMGDFNAAPHDPIFKVLTSLIDLTPQKRRPAEGTYRYKGLWSWIDHVMVSPPMTDLMSPLNLYTAPWLQDNDSHGGWHPCRTYLGSHYHGGVSDHVPIFCDITFPSLPSLQTH